MPCRSDGYEENVPAQPAVPDWMLCEAMVIIEKKGQLNECSIQLKDWWRKHQEKEESRVRGEAAAKLNPRERLALGIDECGNPVRRTRLINGG